MPSQQRKRFAVEINMDGRWCVEVYTDWYNQALPIAMEYIGIHHVRVRDLSVRQVVWEAE